MNYELQIFSATKKNIKKYLFYLLNLWHGLWIQVQIFIYLCNTSGGGGGDPQQGLRKGWSITSNHLQGTETQASIFFSLCQRAPEDAFPTHPI